MTDELDLDELEKLLAQPEPTRRSRKPKTDDRTITGWFKLPHTSQRPCEVPTHDEADRPRNKGMSTVIKEVAVCRICYLSEKDR